MLPALDGFRVLNYDLYGHGDSLAAEGEASLSVYSDQLAGLLDHLGVERASLVGFSIGGMINRRFALDHGSRLHRLIILNSPHDRGEEAQEQVEARAALVREQGAFSTMDAALSRWFTPGCLRQSEQGGDDLSKKYQPGSPPAQVIEWRKQVDPESYAQAAWVLASGVRELSSRTSEITAPTLVMTCENDTGSTPAMSHVIAAEIAGSEVRIVPNLQHLGLMEAPDVFADAIQCFLE